jgi:hypothetical protein
MVAGLARTGLGLLALMVALVVVGAAPAAVDGDAAQSVRDGQVAAANLLAGMADQQTGLITDLQPAPPGSPPLDTQGRQETDDSLAALRQATAGTAGAAQEVRVESAVRDWQTWADDVRARSAGGGLRVIDPAVTAEGRRCFAVFAGEHALLVGRLETGPAPAAGRIGAWSTLSVLAALGGTLAVALWLAAFAVQVNRRVPEALREIEEPARRELPVLR